MKPTSIILSYVLFILSFPVFLEAQPACATANCCCAVPPLTVTNGNFETPQIAPQLRITYSAGNSFGAWLVNSGEIDLLAPTYINWASGNPNGPSQFIDLHGLVPGTISTQLVGLISNTTYTFSIWYAKNPGAASATCNITVANGAWLNQSWTATNNPASGWEQICFSFTALAATAELRLAGSGPASAGGVLLDDITLWGCCANNANAGSFQSLNLVQACQNQSITVPHLGNQTLNPGSALSFVLVADSMAALPAGIVQTSATPTFSFNPATMSVNTVYYVAAVAAPGAAGAPNWASNCLDLSYFASLVWKPVPTVMAGGALPVVCENRCVDFSLDFTGAFPISLSWSLNLGSQILTGVFLATAANQVLTICPPTGQSFPVGSLNLQFVGISDAFCVCP
jgi:hypothetical protein